jgi:hypothetical protein
MLGLRYTKTDGGDCLAKEGWHWTI